jgi:ribosomal protein L37E
MTETAKCPVCGLKFYAPKIEVCTRCGFVFWSEDIEVVKEEAKCPTE